MLSGQTDAAELLRLSYGAAADHRDDPALAFWEYFARRTVDRLGLPGGGRVLDVCCGTGAAALAAAERVGPGGRVIGIDIASPLLVLARRKAAARGLTHATFLEADVERFTPTERFDAVICVFGICLLPDMAAAMRRLWGWLRPGGALAITTWGHDVLEPGRTLFREAVRELLPDLERTTEPWGRIPEPAALIALYSESGIENAEAVVDRQTVPLASADDFWPIVLGTSYRAALDRLSPEVQERLRERVLRPLRARDVRSLENSIVYAVARRT